MAGRYSQLFTLPVNLYSKGSPVLIEAGALLRDNVTGGVLAQLKIKSISNKIIKALTVGIIPYDVAERQLSDAVMHQYLDLSLGRDSEFGQKNAIALPNPATRSFKVYVSELVFDDNSIYSFPKNEWVSLDIAKVPVSQILNDDVELIKQFHATYGAQYKYLPKREHGIWLCSCGSINHDDEANCHNCGQEYIPFEKVDINALKTARDERVAEERRQANEATRLAKTKRKKILSITLPVVAVCIAFIIVFITVFIPKIKLNKAISMLDSGDYDSAYALFEEIGDKAAIDSNKYDRAIKYIDSGDYRSAYALLEEIGDKETINSNKYDRAIKYIDSGDYRSAYALLEEIGDKETINSNKYDRAIKYIDSGDYDSAYALLEGIEDKEAIESSKYDKAIEYINSGNYEAAYILLDGMVYKDSENKLQSIKPKYQQILIARANVGDVVCFGAYEQDIYTSYGKEDIEWLVLAKEKNKVLVISARALDCKPYNTSRTNITWESCSLRKWLNDTFLITAFNTEEQAIIQSTYVPADKNPRSDIDPGKATTDKVFLLSFNEAIKYFSVVKASKCIPTNYAKGTLSCHICTWWLRSPGPSADSAVCITEDGSADRAYVDAGYCFVRPAMWISTED